MRFCPTAQNCSLWQFLCNVLTTGNGNHKKGNHRERATKLLIHKSLSVLVPSWCAGLGGPGPGGRSIGNSGDAVGDHGVESLVLVCMRLRSKGNSVHKARKWQLES